MTEPSPLILAIESGIAGGSVAILCGPDVIASAAGDGSVSRAEELLPTVDRLLNASKTPISAITAIAVSRGSGSFTGIRIGMSAALGLARSLEVPCIGVSVFDAMKYSFPEADARIAIPISRSDIALGRYSQINNSFQTEVVDLAHLKAIVAETAETKIMLHGSLFESIPAADRTANVVNIGTELAVHIGRYASTAPESSLSPIYLQHPAKQGSLF